MSDEEAVTNIQRFFANTVSMIDIDSEPIILEGIAYVWQRNHEWSDDFTASVIALLLGNYSIKTERPPDEDLYENPF
jgi:hypothetical protein